LTLDPFAIAFPIADSLGLNIASKNKYRRYNYMKGFIRKLIGQLKSRQPKEILKSKKVMSDHNLNFDHRFDASDQDLDQVRDLNTSDLRSDGSSDFSSQSKIRVKNVNSETLTYPHAPDLKEGKIKRAS
jgi:hypothetical protein